MGNRAISSVLYLCVASTSNNDIRIDGDITELSPLGLIQETLLYALRAVLSRNRDGGFGHQADDIGRSGPWTSAFTLFSNVSMCYEPVHLREFKPQAATTIQIDRYCTSSRHGKGQLVESTENNTVGSSSRTPTRGSIADL